MACHDNFDHVATMTISVGIIDDSDPIRESLQALLHAAEGFECTYCFASCEEALAEKESTVPDVVLMDINLGTGMSGIEGVRQFKQRCPGIDIIMLTVYDDDAKVFEALCAGATGYQLKNTPPEKLIEAINEVHAGGAPITSSIARRVLTLFTQIAPVPAADFQLTRREKEILQHLVSGSSYKGIAHDLFVSIDTVSSHVKSIYQKLQVHSKSEAVLKAIRHRIV